MAATSMTMPPEFAIDAMKIAYVFSGVLLVWPSSAVAVSGIISSLRAQS